jgi:hypothetical protein
MVAVRVMEMAVDQIVDVVGMGDCFMATACGVDMVNGMTTAGMVGGANVGVPGGHFDYMLIDMVAMQMMEMPIMQIVDMVVVANGGVAAIGTMPMAVIRMMGNGA